MHWTYFCLKSQRLALQHSRVQVQYHVPSPQSRWARISLIKRGSESVYQETLPWGSFCNPFPIVFIQKPPSYVCVALEGLIPAKGQTKHSSQSQPKGNLQRAHRTGHVSFYCFFIMEVGKVLPLKKMLLVFHNSVLVLSNQEQLDRDRTCNMMRAQKPRA